MYYMYGTGGGADKGFAAYSSKDLVHWKKEGQVYFHNNKNGWSDPIIQGDKNAKRAQEVAYANADFNGIAWPGQPTAATDAVDGGTYYTDMMADVLGGKAIDQVVADYTKKIVEVYKDFGFKGQ